MIRATLRPGARIGLGLALLAALLAGPAGAQQGEPAMMKRAGELRGTPGDAGRPLATLAAQEPITRLADRQGPWIQVQTRSGAVGWVHMFDVGPAGASDGAASGGNAVTGGLRGITSLLRGGSSQAPRVATATIGIRGLDAEDLARAQPNLPAVGQMEKLRQGENGAREFAAGASLAAATVPALPAPSRQRSPQPGGRSDSGQQ